MANDNDFRLLQKELNAIREEIRILKRGALASLGSSETVLQNEAKVYFSGANGLGQAGYIYQSADDDFVIGNFADGQDMLFNNRDSGGTQRALTFRINGTSITPELIGQDGLRVVTSGIGADVSILPGGDIFVTTYERHIQIPARITGLPANQPAEVDFFTTGGLQFATTGAKYAFFQWELPDDWDGTDVYVEIDWFPDSAAMAGTDTVQWTIEYRCTAEGEVHGAGTSKTIVLTNSDDNARYLSIHSRGTMPYNDGDQPLTKQDHIYFKISRNTAVANDFGGTVTIPAFEIIYNSIQIPRGN